MLLIKFYEKFYSFHKLYILKIGIQLKHEDNWIWLISPLENMLSVVNGFIRSRLDQEYEIDYEETFAYVARLSSVKTLIVVSAARKWLHFQMDVKNAFLNGELSEKVYLKLPPGYSHPSGFPHRVFRLQRALYGLKQAPRAWFAKFSSTISQHGFSGSSFDTTLFLRRSDHGITILLLYVDDMIITSDDMQGIQDLKHFLSCQFEIKDLGPLNYFLGL